jgi:hypothetical protein
MRFECPCTTNNAGKKERPLKLILATFVNIVAAHTGLEPVISALRGQRVNQLHQCAAEVWDYRCGWALIASLALIGRDGCGSVLICYTAPA